MHHSSYTRLSLEALEDRTTPAFVPLPNILAGDLDPQIAHAQTVALASPLVAAVLTPTAAPADSLSSPEVAARGFAGRFVLPGTGVQARVANGPGPLAQLPGLFLAGSSDGQPDVPKAPAPTPVEQSTGEGHGDAGGQALDDVWFGIGSWLAKHLPGETVTGDGAIAPIP
jgi:hypothetical protein